MVQLLKSCSKSFLRINTTVNLHRSRSSSTLNLRHARCLHTAGVYYYRIRAIQGIFSDNQTWSKPDSGKESLAKKKSRFFGSEAARGINSISRLKMFSSIPATELKFQHNAKLHVNDTTVLAVQPISALEEVDRGLYKQANPETDYVVITSATIFHPQGGGQPSDVGIMTSLPNDNSLETIFEVSMARHAITSPSHVLHFGRFKTPSSTFHPQQQVTQTIDSEKRWLYSRYHTAGHVLGAAVRHLLETRVENFDELKASHFPDSAACEFQGLIDGKYKDEIQAKVDAYISSNMDVQIDWWGRQEFEAENLGRLIPQGYSFEDGGKLRVVKIVGAEVYPCGGTHVDTTELCGKTTVRKISRSKGNSKVSYAVGNPQ